MKAAQQVCNPAIVSLQRRIEHLRAELARGVGIPKNDSDVKKLQVEFATFKHALANAKDGVKFRL